MSLSTAARKYYKTREPMETVIDRTSGQMKMYVIKVDVDKCQACHVKVFKMKRGQTGPLTMAKMQAGEQCGACHTGTMKVGDKVVFAVNDGANCGRCHKKP